MCVWVQYVQCMGVSIRGALEQPFSVHSLPDVVVGRQVYHYHCPLPGGRD